MICAKFTMVKLPKMIFLQVRRCRETNTTKKINIAERHFKFDCMLITKCCNI